jgi:hypothetical protein
MQSLFTAEKKFAQKQKEILTKENFLKVFTEEKIEKSNFILINKILNFKQLIQ